MNILNLSSLLANIKDSSNMNGKQPNPGKKRWKTNASPKPRKRDAVLVKSVPDASPLSTKSVNSNKLNAERRRSKRMNREKSRSNKDKISVPKDASKRKRKSKKMNRMKKLLKVKLFRKLWFMRKTKMLLRLLQAQLSKLRKVFLLITSRNQMIKSRSVRSLAARRIILVPQVTLSKSGSQRKRPRNRNKSNKIMMLKRKRLSNPLPKNKFKLKIIKLMSNRSKKTKFQSLTRPITSKKKLKKRLRTILNKSSQLKSLNRRESNHLTRIRNNLLKI